METRDSQVSKKTHLVENRDRFSDMPNEVIHLIFSSLQTIELVHASVLSKRWRYVWTSMPYLNFDKSERSNKGSLQGKFAAFMKRVLFLSDRSNIYTFRVSSIDESDAWVMHIWLDVAHKRNVQQIDLDIVPPPLERYELFGKPGLVFGKSLVELKLNLNYKRMPTTLGCEGLMALHLVSIVFPNEDFAREVLSRCPLLEKLTMERCMMRHVKLLEIFASNLIHLTFVNSDGYIFCDHGPFGGVLKVEAPKLLSFVYSGFVLRDCQIENLSSLERASFHFVGSHEQPNYRFCRMIKGFYNANILRLTIPRCFPTVDGREGFATAKSLPLCPCFTFSPIQLLIHLLKNFPNLEALAIDCRQFCDTGVPMPMEPWFEVVSCVRWNLKRVELINTNGTKMEIEFIRYFLSHGKVLEEVSIPWTKNMDCKLNQFRKAFDFSKASPYVVISFPKHQPPNPFC